MYCGATAPLRQIDKAVLYGSGLNIQAHLLVTLRNVTCNSIYALGDSLCMSGVPEALSSIRMTVA